MNEEREAKESEREGTKETEGRDEEGENER